MTHHIQFSSFPPPRCVSLRAIFSIPPAVSTLTQQFFPTCQIGLWSYVRSHLVLPVRPFALFAGNFSSRSPPASWRAPSARLFAPSLTLSPSRSAASESSRSNVNHRQRPSHCSPISIALSYGPQQCPSPSTVVAGVVRWRRTRVSRPSLFSPLTLIVSSVRVALPSFRKAADGETTSTSHRWGRTMGQLALFCCLCFRSPSSSARPPTARQLRHHILNLGVHTHRCRSIEKPLFVNREASCYLPTAPSYHCHCCPPHPLSHPYSSAPIHVLYLLISCGCSEQM